MASQGIPFTKMVASGNDFVVIDNRKKIIRDLKAFTREVCSLHTGIGADGVLLVEHSRKGSFQMRIVNSDGSEAEACGNGFRCIALFAHKVLGLPFRFQFESLAGMIQAHIQGSRVKVQLTDPENIKLHDEIEVSKNRLHYSFLNTGVPHTVLFVEGLEKIDVPRLGSSIRWHKQFQPKGTNVNFVEVKNRGEIAVRTYERGVENETLACGTGSTASAIASALLGYTKAPVRVKTRGGETLVIDFLQSGNKISQVFLEGEARIVYEGVYFSKEAKKK